MESLAFSYGAPKPIEGIRLATAPLPVCGPQQVVVQFLAAPINPLDLLVIQGKYPVKPQNSIVGPDKQTLAIPGSDGAARVVQTGTDVSTLAVDDIVILRAHCHGTWRTHGVFAAKDLIRVPSGIDPRLASILRMGAAPAYFQLRDYRPLEPGDWILQNAATGTISHFVTQLAPMYGVRVISVIRDRGTADELARIKRSLQSHGSALVVTHDELRTTTTLDDKRIVLAVDSVSDDALAKDMAARLIPGGTLVTAGFLGVSTGEGVNLRQFLWQRNITLQAFRLSDCLGKRSLGQQTALIEWLAELLTRGVLTAPALEYVHWKRGEDGLEQRLKESVQAHEMGAIGERKKILVFD
ncbi:GroES-like protein [Aspergillus heteromorphus CBS 117.55]|uniref:enoyl-[acyl-carrier-protein] reductase n=1 Tax=Aspergillus heteromorphus CBS 117.55 TaxID=1448321 RepID=A0A317WF65_9EURO|nr:GroES-like protein [Aspergillus heteromorphus CBS 117.55]PWY85084.1 GroES-like protein [Aspergillus heteromorphus CBS 117.55]